MTEHCLIWQDIARLLSVQFLPTCSRSHTWITQQRYQQIFICYTWCRYITWTRVPDVRARIVHALKCKILVSKMSELCFTIPILKMPFVYNIIKIIFGHFMVLCFWLLLSKCYICVINHNFLLFSMQHHLMLPTWDKMCNLYVKCVMFFRKCLMHVLLN